MRFVILDIWKDYGIRSDEEWVKVDLSTRFEMIAKRELEIERDIRLHNSQKQQG